MQVDPRFRNVVIGVIVLFFAAMAVEAVVRLLQEETVTVQVLDTDYHEMSDVNVYDAYWTVETDQGTFDIIDDMSMMVLMGDASDMAMGLKSGRRYRFRVVPPRLFFGGGHRAVIAIEPAG